MDPEAFLWQFLLCVPLFSFFVVKKYTALGFGISILTVRFRPKSPTFLPPPAAFVCRHVPVQLPIEKSTPRQLDAAFTGGAIVQRSQILRDRLFSGITIHPSRCRVPLHAAALARIELGCCFVRSETIGKEKRGQKVQFARQSSPQFLRQLRRASIILIREGCFSASNNTWRFTSEERRRKS